VSTVRTRTFGHFLYSSSSADRTPLEQLQARLVCALSIRICADRVEIGATKAGTSTLSTCSDSFRATPLRARGNYEPASVLHGHTVGMDTERTVS
jgi:hypothetical protein